MAQAMMRGVADGGHREGYTIENYYAQGPGKDEDFGVSNEGLIDERVGPGRGEGGWGWWKEMGILIMESGERG